MADALRHPAAGPPASTATIDPSAFALAALIRYPELADEYGLTPSAWDGDQRAIAEALQTVPATLRTDSGAVPLAELAARAGVPIERMLDLSRCQVLSRDQGRYWVRELRQRRALESLLVEVREATGAARRGGAASQADPTQAATSAERLDWILARLAEIRDRYVGTTDDGEVSTLEDAARDYVADQLERVERGQQRLRIVTGFNTIDHRCKGFRRGELSLLVAAAGLGKTTYALNLARNVVAHDASTEALMFSGEMTRRQLGEKTVYAQAQQDQTADLDVWALEMALDALVASQLGRRIHLDTRHRVTPGQMIGTIRRVLAKTEGRLGLVIYDHLRHLDMQARRGTAEHEVLGDAVEALKGVAKSTDLPILVLCHFTRDYKSATGAPTMGWIRGGSRVEDCADNILALWRPEPTSPTELHVLKARNTGRVGLAAELVYDGRSQTFREMPR
jgi:replicative DNA helicase